MGETREHRRRRSTIAAEGESDREVGSEAVIRPLAVGLDESTRFAQHAQRDGAGAAKSSIRARVLEDRHEGRHGLVVAQTLG